MKYKSVPETYAEVLREIGKLVGSIGLTLGEASNIVLPDSEGEIGYWIGVPYWGRGLIPEAVLEIMKHGKTDWNAMRKLQGKFSKYEVRKMENERIKVYVGRRSMCAGDDMNVPNMKSFYLPDSLDELVAKLNNILPFDKWTCYLGHPTKNITGEEDGIMVSGREDSRILISTSDDSETDSCNKNDIVKHSENWYDLIKKNPYLFCE